jgi:pimeloyl-ACP methyl ester carboxylesterase
MLPPTAALLVAAAVAPAAGLPTGFWQVAPPQKVRFDGEPVPIRVTRPRAVVLVHGLLLHPIRPSAAGRPILHDWMVAKSDLVLALSGDFDVFSFGYAQTLPVDRVPLSAGLRGGVEKLRQAGYAEVVLIGHSAGGLVARQFVERFPDSGVTKMIQVATPNAGADLANWASGLPGAQSLFVRSLAPRHRSYETGRPFPAAVEACCVVCKVPRLAGDALVNLDSQWPAELRIQGIPATLVAATHFEAMKAPHAVATIAELARERLARWTPDQVEQGRAVVFGKDADLAAVRKEAAGDRSIWRLVKRSP